MVNLPNKTKDWLLLTTAETTYCTNELWEYIDNVVPSFVYDTIRINIVAEMNSDNYDDNIHDLAKQLEGRL